MNYVQQIRDKAKLILIDAIILSVIPILALLLRFEGVIPAAEFMVFRNSLPWMVMERESEEESPFTLRIPDWKDSLSRACCAVSLI